MSVLLLDQFIASVGPQAVPWKQRLLGGNIEFALAIFLVAFLLLGKAALSHWRTQIGGSRALRVYEMAVFPLFAMFPFLSLLSIDLLEVQMSTWLVFITVCWLVIAGGWFSNVGGEIARLDYFSEAFEGRVFDAPADERLRSRRFAIVLHVGIGIFWLAMLSLGR